MSRYISPALLLPILLWCTTIFAKDRLAPPLTEQSGINYAGLSTSAVVLRSVEHSFLETDGLWRRQTYLSVRILDLEAARDYGRIVIPFNHYYGKTELDFANVLTESGELKSLAPDALQLRVVGGGQDFYEDQSEIVFSLPDVAPGAIIEFQFRSQDQVRAIESVHFDSGVPYWFQRTLAGDSWRADPVLEFHYEMNTPSSISFTTRVSGPTKVSPKIKQSGDRTTTQWSLKRVPAMAIESAMPPIDTLMPVIRSSNSQNWADVDTWAWQKIASKLAATPKITTTLKKLGVSPADSEDTKIRAVYHFMQHNIRYVFAHLGRGGYDPHSPDEVLQSGYGDCKDQTVLAIALLRALNVEAYPVLMQTQRAGKSTTDLVSLIFDHMLVWLPPTAERPAIWLDTTGDRALFPGVSRYLHGQPSLVINGKGGILQAARIEHTQNKGAVTLQQSVDASKRVTIDARIQYSGIMEENIRSWWKHDTNRDTSLRQYLSAFFEDNGQYQLKTKVLNTEDLDKPAEILATFIFDPPEKSDEPIILGASFSQIYRMFGGFSSLQAPETRKNNFVDRFPYQLSMTAHLKTPQGAQPAVIRSSDGFKTPYFELREQGRYINGDYSVEMTFQKPELTLTPAEYKTYYQSLLQLGERGSWLVSLHPDERQKTQAALASLQLEKGGNSVEYLLQLARHHIDQGEFDQALVPAQKAVKINEANGEAWYVLGMAQGFSSQLDDSSNSFAKAKALGYVP